MCSDCKGAMYPPPPLQPPSLPRAAQPLLQPPPPRSYPLPPPSPVPLAPPLPLKLYHQARVKVGARLPARMDAAHVRARTHTRAAPTRVRAPRAQRPAACRLGGCAR